MLCCNGNTWIDPSIFNFLKSLNSEGKLRKSVKNQPFPPLHIHCLQAKTAPKLLIPSGSAASSGLRSGRFLLLLGGLGIEVKVWEAPGSGRNKI